MNRNMYRLKRRMTPIESALAANLFYIIIVLIFKKLTDLTASGDSYNYFLGAVELIVTAVFWIGYNWVIFRRASHKKQGSYAGYIILTMLPIFVASVMMTLAIYLMPGTTFGRAWNEFTFLVAPTVFWYMPFGILYAFIGKSLPMIVFVFICFILVIVFQIIGIAIGSKQRQHMREEAEREELEMQKISAKRAAEPFRQQPVAPQTTVSRRPPRKEKQSKDDPFGDDDEHIIYTEAFTPISDEMLAAVNRDKKVSRQNKKKPLQKKAAVSQETVAKPSEPVQKKEESKEDRLFTEIDLKAVRESTQKIEEAVDKVVQQESAPAAHAEQPAEPKEEKLITEVMDEQPVRETAPITFEPVRPARKKEEQKPKTETTAQKKSSGPQWINPATANNKKIIEALKSAGDTSKHTEKQHRIDREATQDITMQLKELREKMNIEDKSGK